MTLGIDTNVLLRFLIRDNEPQFEKARRLIRREIAAGTPVMVNSLTLLEAEWVLRSRYELGKSEILAVISSLLDTSDIQLENEPSVEEAVYVWKDSGADFADCLIGAQNRRLGCRATATFDRRASKVPTFVTVENELRGT